MSIVPFDSYVYETCHCFDKRRKSPPSVHQTFKRRTKAPLFIKEKTIEVIAERISSIYGACLTYQWQERRAQLKKDLNVHGRLPKVFPSPEQVILFREAIKNKTKELLNKREQMAYISLKTDIGPEGLLFKLLDQCGIGKDWRNFGSLYLFFEERSETGISICDNDQHLFITSDFIDYETPQIISKLWLEQEEPFAPSSSIFANESKLINREVSSIQPISSSLSSTSSTSLIGSEKGIRQAAKIEALTKRNIKFAIRCASICLIAWCMMLAFNCIKENYDLI